MNLTYHVLCEFENYFIRIKGRYHQLIITSIVRAAFLVFSLFLCRNFNIEIIAKGWNLLFKLKL